MPETTIKLNPAALALASQAQPKIDPVRREGEFTLEEYWDALSAQGIIVTARETVGRKLQAMARQGLIERRVRGAKGEFFYRKVGT